MFYSATTLLAVLNVASAIQIPLDAVRPRYDDLLRINGKPVVISHPTESFVMDQGRKTMPWIPEDSYYGIKTFSRSGVPPVRCLGKDNGTLYDVAIVGAPFDTATSYRPGARFGPNGIRQGSQLVGGYNRVLGVDPFEKLSIVDCGDIPMTLFSNIDALNQLEAGYSDLIARNTVRFKESGTTVDHKARPRVLTLGGDHTITLPVLRALAPVYGPITVIHFDSHLDTWEGTDVTTHGNYFYIAWKEGLMSPDHNIHVGIKNGMWDRFNHTDDGDDMVGFSRVYAEEIDDIGIPGIITRIRDRVGQDPVYITLDIDVVDPSFAPATGTPATGGYTPRELMRIIQGLKGLRIIGADIVEVAPAYDNIAESTSIVAASIGFEFLSLMAMTEL